MSSIIWYTFAGWSGDATGSTNPLNVTMSGNKTITALFTIKRCTLTVNATNGTVTKSPDQTLYDSNAVVQLTAVPAVGYTFAGWSGDATGSTNPLNVTMSGNKTITAEFTVTPVSRCPCGRGGTSFRCLWMRTPRGGSTSSPASTTPLHWYENGYHSTETMDPGPGFWLKFPADDSPSLEGLPIDQRSIPVVEGWNMIGSISVPVDVGNIVSEPPGLTTGTFFGYDGGYSPVTSIVPRKGYWVNVMQNL